MAELIVIGGPTASGKTKAAIQLAQYLGCPILSADSRQFFREMTIGTAKPTAEEIAQAEHYFIDNKSISEDYSAGEFARDALAVLHEVFQNQSHAILVGGSGLYIDALCKGMDDLPSDDGLRNELNEIHQKQGLAFLRAKLKALDPEYFEHCDNQNPIRVIRALELIQLTGKKMHELWNKNSEDRNFEVRYLVLDWPRDVLYQRINQRVDQMIQDGLVEEAKSLLPFRDKQALQTVGYKELFDYFDGLTDLNTAIEQIKQNSRRYAKRQITWFKRYKNATWLDPDAFADCASMIPKSTNPCADA